MARPISWLPRLHVIRKAVSSSIRSHYTRRELETLFELQPRAAQKLIELLPTVSVGTSLLVERDALSSFLSGLSETDDSAAYIERYRLSKAAAGSKKLRSFVRRDLEPVNISSLPESMALERGRLEVRFETVEELAEAMYALARVLNDDCEEFARRFEPQRAPESDDDSIEVSKMFRDLEHLERSS